MTVSRMKIQNEMRYIKGMVQPLLNDDHHTLTKELLKLFLYQQEEHIKERGIPIEEYGPYEPELTDRFFEEFDDTNKTIRQIGVEILSDLIVLQPLPNANHRTSISFLAVYLQENGVLIKEYLGNEQIFNEYIHRSNQIIKHDLKEELRKPKYFMNNELEEKAREEFRREHLKMTDEYFDNFIQSGAPQVMPFKRLRAAFCELENP